MKILVTFVTLNICCEVFRKKYYQNFVVMAGGEAHGDAQFKGWQKHFNTYTIRGRSNITYATYTTLAVIGLYMYLKPKKKPQA
ncbi:uncharacterized protein CDAR_485821 [Caerostris darwini]|uniref:Up-regulated during skeletal muscle growth protein 5 n=1 Tax=Caerostris darwini TaxID=1538125 RepID=A0AAV4WKZ6_9ARAC|nr:uncharacterized protein CDAR_485821 [Caerostris darwini]